MNNSLVKANMHRFVSYTMSGQVVAGNISPLDLLGGTDKL